MCISFQTIEVMRELSFWCEHCCARINKQLSEDIIESIKRREKLIENHIKELNLIDEKEINCSYVINTIVANGEAMGSIIIISEEEKLGENEMQIASIVSSFITKYLEE